MSQKRTAGAIVCAIALSMIASAEPAAAQEKLPASVAADVKSNADLCREMGSTPSTANAVKSADLTGDGTARLRLPQRLDPLPGLGKSLRGS